MSLRAVTLCGAAWIAGVGLLATVGACKDGARPTAVADAAAPIERPKASRSIVDAGQRAAPASSKQPAPEARSKFAVAVEAVGLAVVSIVPNNVPRSREAPPLEGTPLELYLHRPQPGEERDPRSSAGSGTILDVKGHILTNNHVVDGASGVRVILGDDSELDGKIIGTDPESDIAVVGVDPGDTKLQPATLGDSDALSVGDQVLACGSSFGFKQTVSAGIVSALGRRNLGISAYDDFIQTDAIINAGNSGGPLLDLAGRVVGINTAIGTSGPRSAGFGFAIPINMARQIAGQLIDHGKVVRGYIGLYMGDVTHKLAQTFNYQGAGGALVEDVTPGGPGARAGVAAGDIIAEQDGQRIVSAAHFRNAIASRAPDTKTRFKLWRDGKWIAVDVTLGNVPGEARVAAHGGSTPPEPRWGLQLADVPLAAEQHAAGMPDHGALVQGVQPESAADTAGLRGGDVIVDIDSKRVSSAADAQRLLETANGLVRVRVVRDAHGLFLVMASRSE